MALRRRSPRRCLRSGETCYPSDVSCSNYRGNWTLRPWDVNCMGSAFGVVDRLSMLAVLRSAVPSIFGAAFGPWQVSRKRKTPIDAIESESITGFCLAIANSGCHQLPMVFKSSTKHDNPSRPVIPYSPSDDLLEIVTGRKNTRIHHDRGRPKVGQDGLNWTTRRD